MGFERFEFLFIHVKKIFFHCTFEYWFCSNSLVFLISIIVINLLALPWLSVLLEEVWGGCCSSWDHPILLWPEFKMFGGKRCASSLLICDCSHFLVQFTVLWWWLWWWLLLYFFCFWWVLRSFAMPSLTGNHFFVSCCSLLLGENYRQLKFCSVVTN